MKIDVALCQFTPSVGDVGYNTDRVISCLESDDADVYIFPELFLTGYGADYIHLEKEVMDSLRIISDTCREMDAAVALGTPHYTDSGVMNGLAFLSPDGDVWYDKAHLARFGIYAENEFSEGMSPTIGHYHGVGFGLCICYDIFFPEILHGCSLNGASVNICMAASAVQSKPFLDKVISARALENVTYLAYVNNVGSMNGLEMHGCSRAMDPFGDEICGCGTSEGMRTFTVDTEVLRDMRSIRRHLEDYRNDIDWLTDRKNMSDV